MEFTWDEEQLEGIARQLESYLRMHTKLDDIRLELKIGHRRNGDEFLEVESNDLTKYHYPVMFKKLEIYNFGGGWSKDSELYWLPLRYGYEHFGGGRNGSSIGTAWISEYGEVTEYQSKLF
jgi:hypothetical protein